MRLTNRHLKETDVSEQDRKRWVREAEDRVKTYTPRVVCFNGLGPARRVPMLKDRRPGMQSCTWAGAEIWAVISSSALASCWHPRCLQCLKCLARYLGGDATDSAADQMLLCFACGDQGYAPGE